MDQGFAYTSNGSSPTASGLPSYLTSFLGRKDDIALLGDLLLSSDIHLVTITGFGGIGKTRLAVEVVRHTAAQWRRSWFVSLAHIHEPTTATSMISRELGLDATDAGPSVTIRHDLQTASCLLVLDNFEHLVDAADHVGTLIHTWPKLTILVTSRSPLNLSAERVFPLPPLSTQADDGPGAAVQLFIERASSRGAHIYREQSDDIARICERLEGIPLAIELAAARTPMFTPASLLDQFTSQLSLLTGGPRDAPARQRTLRDTIAWSYELLSSAEQRFFEALGVFSGGFTAAAVAEVLELTPTESLDHLTSLLASSLVLPAPSPLTPTMRYRLLDPVREFALGQLAASSRMREVHLTHARYYRTFAEASLPLYDGPTLPEAMRATSAELDNFRVAMAWSLATGDREDGVRLAGALWRQWPSRFMGEEAWSDRLSEGRNWIRLALEHSEGLSFQAVREALLGRIFLDANLGHKEHLLRHSEELLAWATDEGDEYAMYWGAQRVWQSSVDFSRPIEKIDETLDHLNRYARRSRQPVNQEAGNYLAMAGALLMGNQVEEATPIVHRAHELALQCGNPLYICGTSEQLGTLALIRGDLGEAIHWHLEARRLQHTLGLYGSLTYIHLSLARVALRIGQVMMAERLISAEIASYGHASLIHGIEYRETLDELRALVGDRECVRILDHPRPLAEEERLALISELAACVDTQAPEASTPTANSLTPREIDVLILLAAGKSNRVIADELSISERTVENHVSHILAKLDLDSRAAAAAWAVRNGIT